MILYLYIYWCYGYSCIDIVFTCQLIVFLFLKVYVISHLLINRYYLYSYINKTKQNNIYIFFNLGTRVDLGSTANHIPNTKTAKEMVELLDFNLLTKEEVDDMKIIAKKINASGEYCAARTPCLRNFLFLFTFVSNFFFIIFTLALYLMFVLSNNQIDIAKSTKYLLIYLHILLWFVIIFETILFLPSFIFLFINLFIYLFIYIFIFIYLYMYIYIYIYIFFYLFY